MTKVLVLNYSWYGHIETVASTVAVRDAGVKVALKRATEIVPEEIARKSGYKLDQPTPLAPVAELVDYDAIIIGAPVPLYALPRPLPSSNSVPPKQPFCRSTPGGLSWRGSI
jgi:NAD(P)H dehydrogenase (quinone)